MMRRRSARVAADVHTNRSRPVSSRGVPMPRQYRPDAVLMPFLAGSTAAEPAAPCTVSVHTSAGSGSQGECRVLRSLRRPPTR